MENMEDIAWHPTFGLRNRCGPDFHLGDDPAYDCWLHVVFGVLHLITRYSKLFIVSEYWPSRRRKGHRRRKPSKACWLFRRTTVP